MAKKSSKTSSEKPSRFDRASEWALSHEGPHPYNPEDIWSTGYEKIEWDPVAFKVFDMAMSTYIGTQRAIVILQAVLRKDLGYWDSTHGVEISGTLDANTVRVTNAAVALYGEQAVLDKLIARAERYHRSLKNMMTPLKVRLRNVRDVYEIVPENTEAPSSKPTEEPLGETEKAGESSDQQEAG